MLSSNKTQATTVRIAIGWEAVAQRCSAKKVFLEISQNSQENTCPRVSFLIKLQVEACNVIKKDTLDRCFPVNFAKFLRTPFLIGHLLWLLLLVHFCYPFWLLGTNAIETYQHGLSMKLYQGFHFPKRYQLNGQTSSF